MSDYNFEGDDFLDGQVSDATPADSSTTTPAAADPAPAAATPEPAADATPAAVPTSTPAATPAPAASTLSPDVSALIARERLPAVPGETDAAALRRLYDHQRQRADRLYYEEVRGAKTAALATQRELAEYKQSIEPLIRAFNERRQEAERELAEAQIPEPGTQEYLAWQQQQIIQRMEQREQREAQEREEAEQVAHQETLITMDEAADYHLEQALTSDPEAKSAYEFAVKLGLRSAQRAYPDATFDQLQEVVRLSHILDMRNALNNGVPPGELFKQRMADVLALSGGTNSNGNGAAKPAAAAPTPAPAKPGSQTAKQLAAGKAKAPARAVVSPSPTAANPPSGDGTDFSQMDEDSLLEFVLASSANAAEYSRWIEQKHGKASWR